MHAIVLACCLLGDCPNCPASGSCAFCEGGMVRGLRYRHLRPDSLYNGMPQSCYESSYGCYAGSRHMHRYPAFHGSYYRSPYNYRHAFDYPCAAPHEPQPLSSGQQFAQQQFDGQQFDGQQLDEQRPPISGPHPAEAEPTLAPTAVPQVAVPRAAGRYRRLR